MPRPIANIVRACICITLRRELATFGRTAAPWHGLDPHRYQSLSIARRSRCDDHLSVNESHEGRSQSLEQLEGLHRPDEVDTGRQGCCTFLLYLRRPVTLKRQAAMPWCPVFQVIKSS